MSTAAIAANHTDATNLLLAGGNLDRPLVDLRQGNDLGGDRLTPSSALWTIETQWAASIPVGQLAAPTAFNDMNGLVPSWGNAGSAFAISLTSATTGIEQAIDPADELLGHLTTLVQPGVAQTDGIFTVGETGQVSINYLFDGGGYAGELALFSLTGLEQWERSSAAFVHEAARRSLSHSEWGAIVIRDAQAGAQFSSALDWEGDFNQGNYLGATTLQLIPGSQFALMLVANGTIQQVFDQSSIESGMRPLFSFTTPAGADVSPLGQLADVTGEGHTFALEDLPIATGGDRDFNDLVFQIQGASGTAAQLDEVIDAQRDWRHTAIGQQLLASINPPAIETTTLPTLAQQPLIGVIDTGFGATNLDVAADRLIWGGDYIDDDLNPLLSISDEAAAAEHGTQVVNVIAATRNNGVGFDGVNDQAPIWLSRAVGSGQWATALLEFVETAKASNQPNAIVNLSFELTQTLSDGSIAPRYSLTAQERQALAAAQAQGILLVVAAGNAVQMSALAQAAAQFDNILTVGAVVGDDRASYSAVGATLDLLAPEQVGNSIAGTSIATAQVTGVASQVWAANPDLSYRQVIEILRSSAIDVQEAGWDAQTGWGLVNLEAAIDQARQTVPIALEERSDVPVLIPAIDSPVLPPLVLPHPIATEQAASATSSYEETTVESGTWYAGAYTSTFTRTSADANQDGYSSFAARSREEGASNASWSFDRDTYDGTTQNQWQSQLTHWQQSEYDDGALERTVTRTSHLDFSGDGFSSKADSNSTERTQQSADSFERWHEQQLLKEGNLTSHSTETTLTDSSNRSRSEYTRSAAGEQMVVESQTDSDRTFTAQANSRCDGGLIFYLTHSTRQASDTRSLDTQSKPFEGLTFGTDALWSDWIHDTRSFRRDQTGDPITREAHQQYSAGETYYLTTYNGTDWSIIDSRERTDRSSSYRSWHYSDGRVVTDFDYQSQFSRLRQDSASNGTRSSTHYQDTFTRSQDEWITGDERDRLLEESRTTSESGSDSAGNTWSRTNEWSRRLWFDEVGDEIHWSRTISQRRTVDGVTVFEQTDTDSGIITSGSGGGGSNPDLGEAGAGTGDEPSLVEAAISLGLGLSPAGDAIGVVEAITGRDAVTGEELAPWERVLGAIPLLNDAGKLIELGDVLRRSIALATDASRAAEAAGDRRKAREVADSIGEGFEASQRRLDAARATGDADLIAEAQDDVNAAQTAYQNALGAAERACFVAGTLIATPTGMRAIESLKVGETVLAGDPTTGEVKECRILQTFVHEVSQVFEVQVGEETIGCSAEHPFWVVDQGWTHANRLQVGDQCLTSVGQVVAIKEVRSRLEKVTVYNFEVENLHTYFVSNLAILVHNTNCSNHQFPTNPAQIRHIFDTRKPGHLPDTPENRALLLDVADDPATILGSDMYGNTIHGRILPDGRQAWVRTRNGLIDAGGINDVPRTYDPQTGFNRPIP